MGAATRRALSAAERARAADYQADLQRTRGALSDAHTRRLIEHQAAQAAPEVDDAPPHWITRAANRLPSPQVCDAIVFGACILALVIGVLVSL